MAKAKDTLFDAAESIKPYVERAMTDERLRDEVMRAFGTARELYGELLSGKDKPITVASRVATDDDIRDKLREAIEDLRQASERLQGKIALDFDTARRLFTLIALLHPGG